MIENPSSTQDMDACQIDILQITSQLKELHPLNFRLAFGLTHEQAAEILGLEAQTMRAYSKKRPSRRVKKLAATIAKKWLSEDRQLADVQFLVKSL